MNWTKVEEINREKLPKCIKEILNSCGYDTFGSLNGISEESLKEIENHINTSRATIEALDCCYSEYYKSQDEFKLLPGHRDLIVTLSKLNYFANEQPHSVHDSQKFSFVLKELINTATMIENKCSKYSDIIRWFATYIFLLCGRSCYEVLNHNLPLPSTRTVRKYRKLSNIFIS